MSFNDFLDIFGGLASTILSIAACLTLFVNPVRKKAIQWVKKTAKTEAKEEADKLLVKLNKQVDIITDDIEGQILIDRMQTEALLSLLRSSITHIYYKNEGNQTLREYEAKALRSHIDAYTALGGNSFVQQLSETMKQWKITD